MSKVPSPCLWLTRDSFDGQLESKVDVWTSPPTRDRIVVGVTEWWDMNSGTEFLLERLTIAQAKAKYRTIPETDRECVRIG